MTPGIFVDRVVAVGDRAWLAGGRFAGGVDVEGRLAGQVVRREAIVSISREGLPRGSPPTSPKAPT